MAKLSFSASVGAWVAKTKERSEAVFHKSAEKVAEEVQDRTPIDTGYLVHSFQASAAGMPRISQSNVPPAGTKGIRSGGAQSYYPETGPIQLVIRGVPLGGAVHLGFSAAYAAHVEYGTSKMAPRRMVGQTAQRWPQIVQEAVREAKASVRGTSR